MKHKVNAIVLVALWLVLTLAAWFAPAKDISLSERRPLQQRPQLTTDTLLSGKFMGDFEEYSLDQFPLRDSFRTLKSLVHYYIWNQSDNNSIYLAQGMAARQEYPLNGVSMNHAANHFQSLYENYLQGSKVYFAIVPDKGQYLAGESGHLKLDMQEMWAQFRERLPWAVHVDISGYLGAGDYYRTDTHWRQERLLAAAEALCNAMAAEAPNPADYRVTALEEPFYGVYFGQAALPMDPETIYLMESDLLSECTVYDYETGKTLPVYDRSKLTSRDLYDVFLSGAKPLLTIENPNGAADRELIVFRDSFGSSMVPLLINGYSRVTLVDTRYIQSGMLSNFIDFHGQDVLLLYSTLVLNNSETLK